MSVFANTMIANFPVMLDTHGEAATYILADTSTVAITVIATGKPEALALEDTWEAAAKQIEIFVAASQAPATFTPREDQITVRGLTYTVLERDDSNGAIYKYLCERSELEAVALRSRRY